MGIMLLLYTPWNSSKVIFNPREKNVDPFFMKGLATIVNNKTIFVLLI
jgi:hypothetical protein